jgi:peptidoglycan/xylan/chitin deacetylase (PgdA/CDA1 family)
MTSGGWLAATRQPGRRSWPAVLAGVTGWGGGLRVARLAGWAAGIAGVTAAGYWTMMSPYSQLLGPFPCRADTEDKIIALTFDDGPNEPYTSQIADVLARAGIRATFFQVGECVDRYPQVTARLARDGHVVGDHSHSHRLTWCLTARAQRSQTRAAQQALTRALGRTPALYRPPWLLRTPTLPAVLRQQGLTAVSGEFCHALEVFQPSPRWIARRALAKARPGAILIFHDGFDANGGKRANTVAAVPMVIAELTRRGYRFVTIDDLLGIPAYQPQHAPRPPGS